MRCELPESRFSLCFPNTSTHRNLHKAFRSEHQIGALGRLSTLQTLPPLNSRAPCQPLKLSADVCGCHCQGAHIDARVGRGAAPRFPGCAWLVLHVVPPMGLSGASPPALLALPCHLGPVLRVCLLRKTSHHLLLTLDLPSSFCF